MAEIFRECVGWPGYEVSDLGRVRSVGRWMTHHRYPDKLMWWKPKILKPGRKPCGHLQVVMTGQVTVLVALLVAEAFIGPRPDGLLVRHLNDIPDDDRASNLAYGTQVDNMEDAARNGHIPRGRARPNTKLHEDWIPAIRKLGSSMTLSEISRLYSVSPATIRDVLTGVSWGHIL